MTETEVLFLRTLSDLEAKVLSYDPYDNLLISALIRKLLLESFPLVDKVNRQYGKKIKFGIASTICLSDDISNIDGQVILDGLDPDTSPNEKRQVNRDEFFSSIICVSHGKPLTVREVILFEAHVMGGIHVRSPKTAQEEALRIVSEFINVYDKRSSLTQLKSIGRVVIKALKPLANEIGNH